jgi:iron uptake system EfeUOB component EfeO/EfeM
MKGTDKQIQYAKSIVDKLAESSAAILADTTDYPAASREAVSHYYQAQTAKDVALQMDIIKAVDAGDLARAEALFVQTETFDLDALLDGDEISAARVIDRYKKAFYAA